MGVIGAYLGLMLVSGCMGGSSTGPYDYDNQVPTVSHEPQKYFLTRGLLVGIVDGDPKFQGHDARLQRASTNFP